MKPYTVLTVPNPKLRHEAAPVAEVNDEIRTIFERMIVTMEVEDGLGLAATQVGIDKRLVVMSFEDENGATPHHDHDHEGGCCGHHHGTIYRLANPEIIEKSSEMQKLMDGCLSVPDQHAEVSRAKSVKIRYLDENNETQTLEADGLLAFCIQHEIDHLNGVLFVDHLSAIKRKLIIQRAMKVAARYEKQRNA
ncbi:MAG TPA: peptide deformylase [Holosporales bacterium]|nr:peptide deformylase [Holosporales bacterium]